VSLAPNVLFVITDQQRADHVGFAGNPVVRTLTSDHGDMMGDHGLIMKLLYHYQGCVRVPLVIADEGRLTRYSTGAGQLFDLAAIPDEARDLWREPGGGDRRAALFERLAQELMEADAMARPEPGPVPEVPDAR
jgi:hypothetical protein